MKIQELRELVQERFPQGARQNPGLLPTGIDAIDRGSGGLPRAALTEVVCRAPSCGSQLLLGQVLRQARARGGRMGLIDGGDQFDPAFWPAEALEALVWVRCRRAEEALPVADILARDANLEILAVDLRPAAPAVLRRIPAPSWYRLQRAAEQSGLALLILTPRALVPSASLRLDLAQSHRLGDQILERDALGRTLLPSFHRQRLAAAG